MCRENSKRERAPHFIYTADVFVLKFFFFNKNIFQYIKYLASILSALLKELIRCLLKIGINPNLRILTVEIAHLKNLKISGLNERILQSSETYGSCIFITYYS